MQVVGKMRVVLSVMSGLNHGFQQFEFALIGINLVFFKQLAAGSHILFIYINNSI